MFLRDLIRDKRLITATSPPIAWRKGWATRRNYFFESSASKWLSTSSRLSGFFASVRAWELLRAASRFRAVAYPDLARRVKAEFEENAITVLHDASPVFSVAMRAPLFT